jgi:hypothetical protein
MPARLSLVPALAASLLLAWAGQGEAGQTSGVRGVVLNATCYGPCVEGAQQDPYAGGGLELTVRRLPGRSVVARPQAEQGHFRARLAPGVYLVRADVSGRCWQGEARRVVVRRGLFSYVRMHVQNVCIV